MVELSSFENMKSFSVRLTKREKKDKHTQRVDILLLTRKYDYQLNSKDESVTNEDTARIATNGKWVLKVNFFFFHPLNELSFH